MTLWLTSSLHWRIIRSSHSFAASGLLSQVSRAWQAVSRDPRIWTGDAVDLRWLQISTAMWCSLLPKLDFARSVVCVPVQLRHVRALPLAVDVCVAWLPLPPFRALTFVPLVGEQAIVSDGITPAHVGFDFHWTGGLLGLSVGFTTAYSVAEFLDGYFTEDTIETIGRFYHCIIVLEDVPPERPLPPHFFRWWINGLPQGRAAPVLAHSYVTDVTLSPNVVAKQLKVTMSRKLNAIELNLNGQHIDTFHFDFRLAPDLPSADLAFAVKPLLHKGDRVEARFTPMPMLVERKGNCVGK